MNRTCNPLIALLAVAWASAAVGDEGTTVIRHADEDGDRTPLFTVAPAYPEIALRDRIEGEVQVCFEIDRSGRPYRIAVRESSHRVFEKPARLAVRASSWVPLGPDEKRSGIKTCRTFRFELEPVALSDAR